MGGQPSAPTGVLPVGDFSGIPGHRMDEQRTVLSGIFVWAGKNKRPLAIPPMAVVIEYF
jgi:hypothetical protein